MKKKEEKIKSSNLLRIFWQLKAQPHFISFARERKKTDRLEDLLIRNVKNMQRREQEKEKKKEKKSDKKLIRLET